MKDEFEKAAQAAWPEMDTKTDSDGIYVNSATRWAWFGWQLKHALDVRAGRPVSVP